MPIFDGNLLFYFAPTTPPHQPLPNSILCRRCGPSGKWKNQHCLRARGLGENVSKTFENRLLLRRVSTIFSLIVACSRGSCGGTSLKRGEFRLHSKRPHALALVAKAPNIVQLKITLRPSSDAELSMSRTKYIELSTWKVRRLNQLGTAIWIWNGPAVLPA